MARSVFYYHLNRLKAADRYANEKESIKTVSYTHITDFNPPTSFRRAYYFCLWKEYQLQLWTATGGTSGTFPSYL